MSLQHRRHPQQDASARGDAAKGRKSDVELRELGTPLQGERARGKAHEGKRQGRMQKRRLNSDLATTTTQPLNAIDG